MDFILKTPIYNLFIAACVTTGLCLISLVVMVIFDKKIVKTTNEIDTDKAKIKTIKVTNIKKYKIPMNISRICTIIFAIISIIGMTTYMYFNHKALKYGAFDGYMHVESISSINDNAKYGFIESDDIPDDLSGCIIIYYKFGCDDCARVHDPLLESLKKNGAENYYFVSSRSKIGEKLRETYPIDAVPTGVYIRRDKNANVGHYTKVLYDTNSTAEDTDIFVEENLLYLINAQKEGK